MFHYHIAAGRWFTAAEEQGKAHVATERDIARTTGTQLGDTIHVRIAPGVVAFRVIGISSNQQEDGTALYAPLTTMHALIPGMPPDASDYWVRTTSQDHALIDRTTTRVENVLNASGYNVSSQIVYVMLDMFLVWMTKKVVLVEVPFIFPIWNVLLALVGTIVLALLITLVPIRRVRFRPGEALRYA